MVVLITGMILENLTHEKDNRHGISHNYKSQANAEESLDTL